MSEYSKLPFIHHLLQSIPFPGASWNEVITTYPSLHHLNWAFVFALMSALLQFICYAFTKTFAPYLIGYSSTPSMPQNQKSKHNLYMKLVEMHNSKKHVDIKQCNVDLISTQLCDNKLSSSEIEQFLEYCNKYHLKRAKNEQRFQESLFPILTKLLTLSLGIYSVYDKEWVYDSSLYFDGWPHEQQLDCCIPDIKLLYIIHIGWYVYKLFGQAVLDRHLKDFVAAFIHHFATIVLMAVSYSNGFVRGGVVVLLLHDPSDLFLQFAKLFRLMQKNLLMNISFGCLVLSWIVTRLVLYPYHCMSLGFNGFYEEPGWGYGSCCVCMCILYILHIYWFKVIIYAFVGALGGKGTKDPRSDTEVVLQDKEE